LGPSPSLVCQCLQAEVSCGHNVVITLTSKGHCQIDARKVFALWCCWMATDYVHAHVIDSRLATRRLGRVRYRTNAPQWCHPVSQHWPSSPSVCGAPCSCAVPPRGHYSNLLLSARRSWRSRPTGRSGAQPPVQGGIACGRE
jgi:hypothetical protein